MDDFRRLFLRGLAALVPTLFTFALLIWAYGLVRDNVGVHINKGLLYFCSSFRGRPAKGLVDEHKDSLTYGHPIDEWNDSGERLTVEYEVIHHPALKTASGKQLERLEKAKGRALWEISFAKYRLDLLGFLIAIVLVYFTGFFLASFIGRTSWRMMESVLHKIPLIRAIYPNVKQVTDFLLSERKVEFSGVVAVQYPRMGLWSIGLRTGNPMKGLQRAVPDELVTVFIPSSPTPVTGYVVQVPVCDVIEMGMTIDEALRFTISGGVILPESPLQKVENSPMMETRRPAN